MFKPGLAIDGRPCLVVDPHRSAAGSAFIACLGSWDRGRPDTGRRDPRSPVCRHPGERARRSACLRAGAQLIGYPDRRRARGCAPPCRCMLLLLARISGGVANVYEDIQTANPFAAAARDSLRAGLSQLDASLSGTADFSVCSGERPTGLASPKTPWPSSAAGSSTNSLPSRTDHRALPESARTALESTASPVATTRTAAMGARALTSISSTSAPGSDKAVIAPPTPKVTPGGMAIRCGSRCSDPRRR